MVGAIPKHAFFLSLMLLGAFAALGVSGSSMLFIGKDGLEVLVLWSVIVNIIGITGVVSILIDMMPPTRGVQSKCIV